MLPWQMKTNLEAMFRICGIRREETSREYRLASKSRGEVPRGLLACSGHVAVTVMSLALPYIASISDLASIAASKF